MRKGWRVISFVATAAVVGWIIHGVSISSLQPSLSALPAGDADPSPAVATQYERFDSAPVASAQPYSASPATLQYPSTQGDANTAALTAALARFSSQLQAYSAGDLDQEARLLAEQTLREIHATSEGRAFVVDSFFSADDPQRSEAMFNLILAADIKDVALIDALTKRDASESSDTFKTRILDLIADVSTRDDSAFSDRIDDYLAQLAQHPEPSLREAAISRRAWYLAQHAKHNSGVLNEYLLAGGMESRREIYELIERHAVTGEAGDIYELALTLQSLLETDYLGMTSQEQEKVAALTGMLRAAQQ